MTWAILSINIKGGTGKSTIAQILAEELHEEGYDVGVIDADIDSANLATRMNATEKVTFHGDHVIEPVTHNGIKVYSMENAFEDSSFSQSGQFMGEVVENMINHSDWGDLDYMIVDCPPGSSDVFEELVVALRANILGAISVGMPNAVNDTARLIKVCNHNWIPIIGFIENMSGLYCHNGVVDCKNAGLKETHQVNPFGKGDIKHFINELDGNFLGDIPLCVDDTEITDVADDTIENMIEAVENAEEPKLPEDHTGDRSFIRNVWGTITEGVKQMNEKMDIEGLQNQFGVEGRDPLVIKIELTDASILPNTLSTVIVTVNKGKIRPMRLRKAKKKNIKIEGGIKISSQDIYDAMRGKKKVMRSINGEVTTEPYSIIDAVKFGDAEIEGEKTINRLAVLDKILSETVDMDDIQDIIKTPKQSD